MVSSHGRFVWYELMTTDMQSAKTFYAKVMGWNAEDASVPGMAYALFIAGKSSVGGLMEVPAAARQVGAMPRWIGYVAVDDVDAAAARAKQLGGSVYVEPTDIPGISRYAVIADPQMAAFVLVKWLRSRPDQAAAPSVGWHELLTTNSDEAWPFYNALFGWQKAEVETGAADAGQAISVRGQTIGAIVAKPAAQPVPLWRYYFNVDDVGATAKRVRAAGGTLLNGPLQVSAGGWIAECADPQGAIFALVGERSSHAVGYFERASPGVPSGTPAKRWSW